VRLNRRLSNVEKLAAKTKPAAREPSPEVPMGPDRFAEVLHRLVEAGVVKLPENFNDLPSDQAGDAILAAIRAAHANWHP
jgi:hypothetical protein